MRRLVSSVVIACAPATAITGAASGASVGSPAASMDGANESVIASTSPLSTWCRIDRTALVLATTDRDQHIPALVVHIPRTGPVRSGHQPWPGRRQWSSAGAAGAGASSPTRVRMRLPVVGT